MVLFFLPANKIHKVGFTATKKIGNAVKRNRAKRRLRALFCEFSHSLKDDFEKVLNRCNAIKKN